MADTLRWIAVVVVLAAVAGCGAAREEAVPVLPKQAARWSLAADAQVVADRIPVSKAAWRARYEGSPAMTLTVYAMPSETSSFDALQKWRPEAGRLAFYKGKWFCLAESQSAAFADLSAFTSAVQAAIH